MEPILRVLGAADTVTGSRYLIEAGEARALVDCGLFQGYKVLRERNRLPFPVPPPSIDAVILTHAHLDHSGYLPALVRDGYRGRVYVTAGTADLLAIMLPDSGRLLEEEAESHRRAGSSRHADPRPLYTEADALRALESLHPVEPGTPLEVAPGVTVTFSPAGHIVGAAQLDVTVAGVRVHFTGDLGRSDDPVMLPPAPLGATDVLITESTYGDRRHPDGDPEAELGAVVTRTAARGGVVLIPAFAVGRAEAVLYHLSRLRRRGEIPDIPVYLNSPMAIDASEVYARHVDELRLTPGDIGDLAGFVRIVRTVEESKALNERTGPMVIVAGSGMITGGRILHHLAQFGPDPRTTVVLTGYQAGGTRGAALAAGERSLRIFGRDVPIAGEVVELATMSAHADADDLISWLRPAPAPGLTLITHGEPHAADTLRIRLRRELGWNARVPSPGEHVALGARDARA